ncbi:UNVERIFIED_CONTAM: hypothetical protein NCL1_47888 [Trichonephila clavipes]
MALGVKICFHLKDDLVLTRKCCRKFQIEREVNYCKASQIFNISGDNLIIKTIARIRTGHYRGMKFDRDGRISYRNCDNCPDTELTPAHIFVCPAILAALQEIVVLFSSTKLYVDNIQLSARTVIWAHGTI